MEELLAAVERAPSRRDEKRSLSRSFRRVARLLEGGSTGPTAPPSSSSQHDLPQSKKEKKEKKEPKEKKEKKEKWRRLLDKEADPQTSRGLCNRTSYELLPLATKISSFIQDATTLDPPEDRSEKHLMNLLEWLLDQGWGTLGEDVGWVLKESHIGDRMQRAAHCAHLSGATRALAGVLAAQWHYEAWQEHDALTREAQQVEARRAAERAEEVRFAEMVDDLTSEAQLPDDICSGLDDVPYDDFF